QSLGRREPSGSSSLPPYIVFQPQADRANGDTILLPECTYMVTCSMGPEYQPQTKQVQVTATGSSEVSFAMERWINPRKYGWYSGDHHVHAAGWSHYQNPTEGVRPEDMVRPIEVEKLNVGDV